MHYHTPLSALFQSHESGFCGSFFQTPCKPRVIHWHHQLVMAHLYWYLDGWVSHEGLANVVYLQFGMLWAQARSTRTPNWTSGFQLSSYFILYSYIEPILHPTPIITTCNITRQMLKHDGASLIDVFVDHEWTYVWVICMYSNVLMCKHRLVWRSVIWYVYF